MKKKECTHEKISLQENQKVHLQGTQKEGEREETEAYNRKNR